MRPRAHCNVLFCCQHEGKGLPDPLKPRAFWQCPKSLNGQSAPGVIYWCSAFIWGFICWPSAFNCSFICWPSAFIWGLRCWHSAFIWGLICWHSAFIWGLGPDLLALVVCRVHFTLYLQGLGVRHRLIDRLGHRQQWFDRYDMRVFGIQMEPYLVIMGIFSLILPV